MKISYMKLILAALSISVLLSACGGALIASSWPNISADTEFVYMAAGGQAVGVRLSDGVAAWKYPEKADNKKSFWAEPIQMANGQLLLASYDHVLYAVDAQTGVEKWSFSEPTDRLVGSPLVTEDSIYQPSSDGNLYALDLSGKPRWKFDAGQPLWSTPVANGGNLYLTSMNHFLYAVSKETGNKVWETDLGAAVPSAPVLSEDGVLYVGSIGNEMLAVNAQTGRVLWRSPLDGGVWSSPLLHDGRLYFGDQTGKLYAMDAATGKMAWPLELGAAVVASPVLIEDGLVLALENGTVQAVDFEGGPLWNSTINGKLYSHPVVAGDRILFAVTGTPEEQLVAFDLQGSRLWSYPPPESK